MKHMSCNGCNQQRNVRSFVLRVAQAYTKGSAVTLREGMLGALLEHGSSVSLFPNPASPPPECRGPNPAPWCKYASRGMNEAVMGVVITEGRQVLANLLLQQGVLERRDAALLQEHVGHDSFHAVLVVALGRSQKLNPAGRLALLESAANVVGLYGPDSPWADICAGPNPPRICWYIHARRHVPFVAAVAREVVSGHLLYHYGLLGEREYTLVLDTHIAALSGALGVIDLTAAEMRALADDEVFSADDRFELVAGATRGSVGLFDPEHMPEECNRPDPPRWCWAASTMPVFDTLLRVLDKKGLVQRTQLLAKLSQLVPTGSRAASH